jgi:hypothetical protein
VGRTFLSSLSFVHHLKKQAPSAHVSRFGLCTNGVQYGVSQWSQWQGAILSKRGQ